MKRLTVITVVVLSLLLSSAIVFSMVEIREENGIKKVIIKPDIKGDKTRGGGGAKASGYTIIGWNDLGMHCISPRFKEMAILPPYNTLMVQVIQKGNPPRIVTTGITVEYALLNNKTVSGKTDFWQYVKDLFGIDLPEGMGLTGNGLSGKMQPAGDHFEATGIPALPYDDTMKWNPYQKAIVTLKDKNGKVIDTTEVVIPVSDEMHCEKCHASGGVAAKGINTPTVEGNILTLHDQKNGTNLMAQRPVLCAECHSSNALGTQGQQGVPSLSRAMHGKHATLGSNAPGCYDCHPGPVTQCNRSAIEEMGPSSKGPNCEKCHGNLLQMADSLNQGRQPWIEEPSCANCHKSYSTGQNLYRNSKGHGGIYCATCHNSPHAWWPSRNSDDNYQPIKLQGKAEAIGKCSVCHTNNPSGKIH